MLRKLLIWRLKNIPHKRFVLILSVTVGVLCGISSAILKSVVSFVQFLLTWNFSVEYANYMYLAYPFIGVLLTVLFTRNILKENIAQGISRILFAISKKKSQLGQKKTWSYLVASTLTVGFGGSVGLEAPIVSTGAAIASNLGRFFHLNFKTKTLLIGCGAAGAIAAIFNAPIAGTIFAMEILMLDLTMASLIPLLLASISGALVGQLLHGESMHFSFPIQDTFEASDVPFYVILGLVTGFISIYFTRSHAWTENLFDKVKNPYVKALAGGVLVGLLIFLFPPLFGDGYETIKALATGGSSTIVNSSPFYFMNNSVGSIVLFMFVTMIFKTLATSTTIATGGVGGFFAPALFLGSMMGNILAKLINMTGWKQVSEMNFTLVGMAGFIAGVQYAPLTAIFLIAEITSGYELFLPLMITAASSFMIARHFEPHSIYTKGLHKRGALITHDKDKAVLTLMKLDKLIEKDFCSIEPDKNLGDLVKIVSQSKRNIYPVVNNRGVLEGIVSLDDIREIMFEPDRYEEVSVEELMHLPEATLACSENMDDVMKKFRSTGAWNLPVLKEGKYEGFMSKSKLFSAYRQMLLQFSQE